MFTLITQRINLVRIIQIYSDYAIFLAMELYIKYYIDCAYNPLCTSVVR